MSAPDTAPAPTTPTTRADILRRFFVAGQNTCEIGRALGVREADVAEVVRAERERRVGTVEAAR